MSHFADVAREISTAMDVRFAAAKDMDVERQRVTSYIADVLKDSHVLYAKLARLQGDFKGREQGDLAEIAQKVLSIGDELSKFARAFRDGEAKMAETSFSYGDTGEPPVPGDEEAPMPLDDGGAGAGAGSEDGPGPKAKAFGEPASGGQGQGE